MARYRDPLLVLFWLAIICSAWVFAADFEKRPVALEPTLTSWPPESLICKKTGQDSKQTGPKLLMFVHPNCPCSQASIAELAKFLSRNKFLDSYAVFIVPDNVDGSWLESKNWSEAQKIPGLQCFADYRATESRLFHARGSGETFLFAGDGRLLFHGGITAARGHQGANTGLDKLQLAAIKSRIPQFESNPEAVAASAVKSTVYPVYGCSLQNCSRANSVR